jgi:hypothetical protein
MQLNLCDQPPLWLAIAEWCLETAATSESPPASCSQTQTRQVYAHMAPQVHDGLHCYQERRGTKKRSKRPRSLICYLQLYPKKELFNFGGLDLNKALLDLHTKNLWNRSPVAFRYSYSGQCGQVHHRISLLVALYDMLSGLANGQHALTRSWRITLWQEVMGRF